MKLEMRLEPETEEAEPRRYGSYTCPNCGEQHASDTTMFLCSLPKVEESKSDEHETL